MVASYHIVYSFIILMHAGTPNTPSITSLSLMENDITISWMIDVHELRPVDKYLIQVQITGSNDKESNSGSEFLTSGDDQVAGANGVSFGGSSRPFEGQVFNITVSESVDDLTCSDARGDINHCEYTLIQETEIGQTYSFIVCAINDFGTACGDSRNITATPPAVTTVTSTSAPPLVTQVSTTVTPPQPTSTTLTLQDINNYSQTVTIVPHGTLATTTTSAQLLVTPLPPPRSGPKTPTGLEGVFVGITFGVVVVVLLCCVLWVSVILLCICCCLRREREKNYWPEEIG